MSVANYRRLVLGLLALILVLAASISHLTWKYAQERAGEKAALNAIMGYEVTRHSLDKMDIRNAIGYLQIYSHPTPSTGSDVLNEIIEKETARIIQDIIAHLRRTTGEDLGVNPEAWIQKYDTRALNRNDRK